ncbi:MAG TPA: hypothetical protein VNI52_14475 [Sphingobacteriaceae bacterium]|nr:hypothetical protein [Sphingobacteriaceae bacterium]
MATLIKENNKLSKIIVIGTSAGGLNALVSLISQLQKNFPDGGLKLFHTRNCLFFK